MLYALASALTLVLWSIVDPADKVLALQLLLMSWNLTDLALLAGSRMLGGRKAGDLRT
jgi:hypothetical protein